jgi:hypothetical protein
MLAEYACRVQEPGCVLDTRSCHGCVLVYCPRRAPRSCSSSPSPRTRPAAYLRAFRSSVAAHPFSFSHRTRNLRMTRQRLNAHLQSYVCATSEPAARIPRSRILRRGGHPRSRESQQAAPTHPNPASSPTRRICAPLPSTSHPLLLSRTPDLSSCFDDLFPVSHTLPVYQIFNVLLSSFALDKVVYSRQ